MKRLLIIVVMVLPLLTMTLPAPVVAQDTVIHVPDDYPTIHQAVIAASPGTNIIVAPGNYAGAIVDKAVKLVGNGAIIDTGPLLGSYPLRTGFFFPGGGAGSGTTICGFIFQGTKQAGWTDDGRLDFPIFSRGANDITIKDNIMNDSLQAITNWEGSGWNIRNNTIDGLWPFNGGGIGILIGSRFGTPANDNFMGFNQITADVLADSAQYTTPGIALMSDARWSFPGGPVQDNKILHNNISITSTEVGCGVGLELTDVGWDETGDPHLMGNKVAQNDPSGSVPSIALNPEALEDYNVIHNNPGAGKGHGLPPVGAY